MRDYGVVLKADSFDVDAAETARLRRAMVDDSVPARA